MQIKVIKQGQSAIESLMTYGWMILLIVAVLVIIYSLGVFSPLNFVSAAPTTSGFTGVEVTTVVANYTYFEFYITNSLSVPINLNKFLLTYNNTKFSNISCQYLTLSPGQNSICFGKLNLAKTRDSASLGISFSISSNINASSNGTISFVPANTKLYLPSIITEFTEEGLPSGYQWWVDYAGINHSSTGTEILFASSASYHSFIVSNLTINGCTFSALPASGTLEAGRLENIIFLNSCAATFIEKELPTGTEWKVTYAGVTNSSTTNLLLFTNEKSGTYTFSVNNVIVQGCTYTPSPSSGSLAVGGYQYIRFLGQCITTFKETGLPINYGWSVTYEKITKTNTTSNIYYFGAPGNFSYSIATLSNSSSSPDCTTTYTPSPSSGSAEAGTTTSISFSASTTCTTTFDESNLPSGYTWTVDYDSATKSESAPSSISFTNTFSGVTPPTYSYSVTTLSNSSSSPDCTTTYTPSPSSGSAEAGTTTSISFSASEHCVTTFTESNLPSGTKWSATYDGITNSSTSNVMSFYTVPGSYSYSIKSADVNPSANSIIGSGTLPTSSGQNNGGEVFDPVNGDIYISDTFAGYVTVVGPSNNIITNIDTGIYPGAIAYDPANGDIYVADISGNQNEVIVINSSTNNIVATIGSLSFPSAIAYDPANGYMYIAEQSSGEVALINAVSNAFVTDYAVGSSPDALAYDPANGDMYVGDAGSNGEILDTSDGSTAGSTTLPVGDIQTGGLGFDPANGDMYAVNSSGEVSIIASSVVDIINTVYVGQPDITSYIIYNPTNGDMVTTGADNNFLYLINSSSNDVTYLVSSDSLDGGLVFDQANGYIYATYSNNNFIFVNSVQGKEGPDTSSGTLESGENLSVSYSRFYVVNSLNLGNGNTPAAISFNPVAGDMLVANYESGNITAITPFSNNGFYTFANIEQGANSITFDQSNSLSYVTNYDTNNVSLLNFSTNPIIAIPVPAPNNISVGSEPDGVAYNPVTGYTYVINYGSNTVSVIGYSSKYSKYMIFQNISEKSDPVDIAYDPANSDIYVSNYLSANIGVINSTGSFNLFSVSKYIADNKGPGALAFDPANGDMYVANSGSNDVSVISSASNEITSTISVGSGPSAIAYDPVNGYIYVANYESSTVSVISSSSNAVIATVPVGSGPDAIAYDPTNGYIYVANALSNTISILS